MKATRANGSTSILTDEDIGEILNRVGKDISKAVDRHELKKDIEAAWDNYCGYSRDTSKATHTKRAEYAAQVLKSLNVLATALGDPDPDAVLARKMIHRHFGLSNFLGQIYELRARLALVVGFKRSSMRETTGASPTQYLVWCLAAVFEKHFGGSATFNRRANDRALVGPFKEFVTGVSAKLDKPILDETAAKALTARRKFLHPPSASKRKR